MKWHSKHIATISLGVMATGYASTFAYADHPIGMIMQTGFEAGLAGGLADWFAIKALFRHPLGIPIPHTALLLKNRKKITHALVRTIQHELLSKDSLTATTSKSQLADRIVAHMIAKFENFDSNHEDLFKLRSMINELPWDAWIKEMTPLIRRAILSIDIDQWLMKFGDQLSMKDYDAQILDFILKNGEEWINKDETKYGLGKLVIKSLEQQSASGWMSLAMNAMMGFMSEERLGGILQTLLQSMITSLQSVDSNERKQALNAVRSLLREFSESESLRKSIANLQTEVANHIQFDQTMLTKWIEPEHFRITTAPLLSRLLKSISDQRRLMDQLNEWIQQQLIHLIELHHDKIGQVVKDNLDQFKDNDLMNWIEQQVGYDLQWIRVNGALCGFVIGLVLGVFKYCVIQ
jgi:uncharacterized membrane-anchored protein YjiN (DUF445 family)